MHMRIYTAPYIWMRYLVITSASLLYMSGPCLWLLAGKKMKYKKEERCRDNTVPKTIRRPCEVGSSVSNLPQPPPYILFLGIAEDCCILHSYLAGPSCITIVFCMVLSLHLSSFLYLLIIVIYPYYSSIL